MKSKQLVQLLVIVVVLVVIGLLVRQRQQRDWSDSGVAVGQPILKEFPLNDVTSFTIEDDEQRVKLHKPADEWRVASRYDYPADFEKISKFLINVSQLKVTQTVAAGESQYGRLNLLPPGAEGAGKGTRVVFRRKADDGKIATLILGKEHMAGGDGGGRQWPNGRYVRAPESETIALVSETFSAVKTDPQVWLDKDFVKISDPRMCKLENADGALWTLVQGEGGDSLTLKGLEEDETAKDSAVRGVANAFGYGGFADVADPEMGPEKTGLNEALVYTALADDGIEYTLRIGDQDDDGKYYVTASARYAGSDKREPAEDESEEDKAKKDQEFAEKLAETREKVEELQSRLDGWVYLVDSFKIKKIVDKERSDFVEKPETEEDNGKDAPAETPPAPATAE